MLACPELESRDHALSYFHRVIENLSIDLQRHRGRQPRLVVIDEAASELEAKWSVNPDFSDVIAAADDAAVVREAISLLSPSERAALIMWELDGRSTLEIAQELRIKESTVRHTLTRARANLRRILSERIIDEDRGLTALDLLSVSYRKTAGAVRKSSKVALSLLLVFSAFLGFNSLAPGDFIEREALPAVEQRLGQNGKNNESVTAQPESESNSSTEYEVLEEREKSQKAGIRSLAATALSQALSGLDSEGVPTEFLVLDSSGSRGLLFSGQQRSMTTETGLLLSNIVSTKSGAVNVLIDQSVIVDAFGTSYVADVSVGINGGWQPLRLSYVSSDIERLASGNYLLTALMMVDSALETAVKVSTSTSGTDLSSTPTSVSTRVLLDSSKTKILAQVVFVSADSQGDGA
jgi:RNA polymerase sigma factor (sigma-70 family)